MATMTYALALLTISLGNINVQAARKQRISVNDADPISSAGTQLQKNDECIMSYRRIIPFSQDDSRQPIIQIKEVQPGKKSSILSQDPQLQEERTERPREPQGRRKQRRIQGCIERCKKRREFCWGVIISTTGKFPGRKMDVCSLITTMAAQKALDSTEISKSDFSGLSVPQKKAIMKTLLQRPMFRLRRGIQYKIFVEDVEKVCPNKPIERSTTRRPQTNKESSEEKMRKLIKNRRDQNEEENEKIVWKQVEEFYDEPKRRRPISPSFKKDERIRRMLNMIKSTKTSKTTAKKSLKRVSLKTKNEDGKLLIKPFLPQTPTETTSTRTEAKQAKEEHSSPRHSNEESGRASIMKLKQMGSWRNLMNRKDATKKLTMEDTTSEHKLIEPLSEFASQESEIKGTKRSETIVRKSLKREAVKVKKGDRKQVIKPFPTGKPTEATPSEGEQAKEEEHSSPRHSKEESGSIHLIPSSSTMKVKHVVSEQNPMNEEAESATKKPNMTADNMTADNHDVRIPRPLSNNISQKETEEAAEHAKKRLNTLKTKNEDGKQVIKPILTGKSTEATASEAKQSKEEDEHSSPRQSNEESGRASSTMKLKQVSGGQNPMIMQKVAKKKLTVEDNTSDHKGIGTFSEFISPKEMDEVNDREKRRRFKRAASIVSKQHLFKLYDGYDNSKKMAFSSSSLSTNDGNIKEASLNALKPEDKRWKSEIVEEGRMLSAKGVVNKARNSIKPKELMGKRDARERSGTKKRPAMFYERLPTLLATVAPSNASRSLLQRPKRSIPLPNRQLVNIRSNMIKIAGLIGPVMTTIDDALQVMDRPENEKRKIVEVILSELENGEMDDRIQEMIEKKREVVSDALESELEDMGGKGLRDILQHPKKRVMLMSPYLDVIDLIELEEMQKKPRISIDMRKTVSIMLEELAKLENVDPKLKRVFEEDSWTILGFIVQFLSTLQDGDNQLFRKILRDPRFSFVKHIIPHLYGINVSLLESDIIDEETNNKWGHVIYPVDDPAPLYDEIPKILRRYTTFNRAQGIGGAPFLRNNRIGLKDSRKSRTYKILLELSKFRMDSRIRQVLDEYSNDVLSVLLREQQDMETNLRQKMLRNPGDVAERMFEALQTIDEALSELKESTGLKFPSDIYPKEQHPIPENSIPEEDLLPESIAHIILAELSKVNMDARIQNEIDEHPNEIIDALVSELDDTDKNVLQQIVEQTKEVAKNMISILQSIDNEEGETIEQTKYSASPEDIANIIRSKLNKLNKDPEVQKIIDEHSDKLIIVLRSELGDINANVLQTITKHPEELVKHAVSIIKSNFTDVDPSEQPPSNKFQKESLFRESIANTILKEMSQVNMDARIQEVINKYPKVMINGMLSELKDVNRNVLQHITVKSKELAKNMIAIVDFDTIWRMCIMKTPTEIQLTRRDEKKPTINLETPSGITDTGKVKIQPPIDAYTLKEIADDILAQLSKGNMDSTIQEALNNFPNDIINGLLLELKNVDTNFLQEIIVKSTEMTKSLISAYPSINNGQIEFQTPINASNLKAIANDILAELSDVNIGSKIQKAIKKFPKDLISGLVLELKNVDTNVLQEIIVKSTKMAKTLISAYNNPDNGQIKIQTPGNSYNLKAIANDIYSKLSKVNMDSRIQEVLNKYPDDVISSLLLELTDIDRRDFPKVFEDIETVVRNMISDLQDDEIFESKPSINSKTAEEIANIILAELSKVNMDARVQEELNKNSNNIFHAIATELKKFNAKVLKKIVENKEAVARSLIAAYTNVNNRQIEVQTPGNSYNLKAIAGDILSKLGKVNKNNRVQEVINKYKDDATSALLLELTDIDRRDFSTKFEDIEKVVRRMDSDLQTIDYGVLIGKPSTNLITPTEIKIPRSSKKLTKIALAILTQLSKVNKDSRIQKIINENSNNIIDALKSLIADVDDGLLEKIRKNPKEAAKDIISKLKRLDYEDLDKIKSNPGKMAHLLRDLTIFGGSKKSKQEPKKKPWTLPIKLVEQLEDEIDVYDKLYRMGLVKNYQLGVADAKKEFKHRVEKQKLLALQNKIVETMNDLKAKEEAEPQERNKLLDVEDQVIDAKDLDEAVSDLVRRAGAELKTVDRIKLVEIRDKLFSNVGPGERLSYCLFENLFQARISSNLNEETKLK